jgi:hypothetical protein
VTEGVRESLDLSSRLDDPNDPLDTLVLTCSEPNISVEGHTLIAFYAVWSFDHAIRVAVDDGEASVGFDVLVHVIDVNGAPDFPVITSPTDGTRALIGESVTFDGEFSDPDMVEGQTITVVWTSNISGELNRDTGTSFEGFETDDLDIGRHMITVTVSDGTYERTASIVLVIEPPPPKVEPRVEESWWPYVLLVVLLVTVLVLVMVWFYRKGGRTRDGS